MGDYALGMPSRTTPFQAMVRMVREHFAQPGVTITESKMLRDVVTGIEREVDVVIDGEFDGEPMVISAEVVERKRPADLTWVESMLRKHRDLATNRLLLVSKSGFSRNARVLIETQAGRVEALTPEVVQVDGSAVITRLYADAVSWNADRFAVHVRIGTERVPVQARLETDVYEENGTYLGSLEVLMRDAMNLATVRRSLALKAFSHPKKELIEGFTTRFGIPEAGYHLKEAATSELHLIELLEIRGDLSVSQTEVPLVSTKLGGRTFAAAEAPLGGRPTVWVGTTDHAGRTTRISWQRTDEKRPPQLLDPHRFLPSRFHELLDLFPSLVTDAILPDSLRQPE